MEKLRIFSISDRYISYLLNDPKLSNVFDNKLNARTHTRKYLGVVLQKNGFNYFVPFSSPKKNDYVVLANGQKKIRKSIIPIIRIITTDSISNTVELKGTLKFSNMIPVPESELTPYKISEENDLNYKQIVEKEWNFIVKNNSLIIKNASVIYNQKINGHILFSENNYPGYLKETVDFAYAETKCNQFMKDNIPTN